MYLRPVRVGPSFHPVENGGSARVPRGSYNPESRSNASFTKTILGPGSFSGSAS